MILNFLLGMVIITFIIILLFDLTPLIKDWFCRIHIGRYSDRDAWKEDITIKGMSWLNKTPKIKVTDNTRLVVIDMFKGNYTKAAIQHWQEASLLLGLSEALKYNDEESAKREINRFLIRKFDEKGQWRKKPQLVDAAILAYAVMKIEFINSNKYKVAYDYIWQLIQQNIGSDGTVEYRKHMKSYRYVDTIGFICPFLVSYGVKYKKEECIDLAVMQIKEFEKYGMLNEQFIPFHAYKVENKIPLGLYGWGRGLGWYAIGLIDSYKELPRNHKYKNLLQDSTIKFAKASMEFQQENGSWNWAVSRNESRADSSTTATLGWFIINASVIDIISDECIKSAKNAISYLMNVTRRDGSIDFSQGDTKDIGVYSTLFNILPFTQGFSIRLIHLNSKVGNLYKETKGRFIS
jgi:unsaturated rhamnogalacturonyl hydrolase